jgi:hypothetical protein
LAAKFLDGLSDCKNVAIPALMVFKTINVDHVHDRTDIAKLMCELTNEIETCISLS